MSEVLQSQCVATEEQAVVSFVVLNWRNLTDTEKCLVTVAAQTTSVPYEVIVVDNESTRASREALRRAGRRLVAHTTNTGYAGGMNSGAAVATGEFLAFVNNDVLLPPTWMDTGLSAMGEGVGVVGGRDEATTVPVVDPQGSTVLTSLAVPRMEVPAVDGAHLLVRRSAYLEVGGFDEDFFAYFDELDLCARMASRGWRVIYEPALHVTHRRGTSSRRLPIRRLYWSRRNRTIWLARHFPHGAWRLAVLAAAGEYLGEVLRPPTGNELSIGDSLRRRVAGALAFAWVISHGRWLAAKRRQTIVDGLHAEDYLDQLIAAAERFAPYIGSEADSL